MDLKSGRILVTGGAGFIGSALVWELNNRGLENILVADYLGDDERWKNLVALRFDDYIEADSLRQQLEQPQFADIRTVFHMGACSSTTETNSRYLIQNNFEYTKQLADWCCRNSKRFVYASSAATYGDGAQGMLDSTDCLNRLRPLNMYGYSKHLFDQHALRRGWLDRIVGLKFFNVFGPNENHKAGMRSVVLRAFEQIVESGTVKLFRSYHPDYHDGEQMRDFVYVKDAVNAAIHLAENSQASGLFNIGSGIASTWIDLVTPIFKAMTTSQQIEFIEMPESLREKYQYYTCANIDRLRAAGFVPGFSLCESVTDYVNNYLKPGHYLGDDSYN